MAVFELLTGATGASATIIARAITINMIQEMIVQEHAEYFVLNDGRLHPTAAAALGRLQK